MTTDDGFSRIVFTAKYCLSQLPHNLPAETAIEILREIAFWRSAYDERDIDYAVYGHDEDGGYPTYREVKRGTTE